MSSKQFNITHLAILVPGENCIFIKVDEQDIVQFLTSSFYSINNLDDKLHRESIQNRLEKQLPGLRDILFTKETNGVIESRELIKKLKKKFGDNVIISS